MAELDENEKVEFLHSIDEIMKKVAACFPPDMNKNQVTAVLQLFLQIYY